MRTRQRAERLMAGSMWRRYGLGQTARREQRLDRVEPGGVVSSRGGLARRWLVRGDRRHKMVTEFAPLRACALEYDDAEAERTTLPDLLEDQLAVRARQRRSDAKRVVDIGDCGGCTHVGVCSATGTATPIIASRVTIAASASSSQPSVPEGRSGSTR